MAGVLDNVFAQVAALLAICAVIGLIADRLRQPLIVGFIFTGILVGPEVLNLVRPEGEIELLAEIGIALLLFVVGLKLDVRLVRLVGPVALATGVGQIVFTSAVGFLIGLALGFAPLESLYLAVALTFSSTIIIVKLLTDTDQIDKLHGRIAIGFLIVQDVAVVIALIALTAGGEVADGGGIGVELARVFGSGLVFFAVVALAARYVIPWVLHRVARSPELLVLFAIAWAVTLAAVSNTIGFSEEVGAFVAGVALASTDYRDTIGSRLSSLRDFLLLFFFIVLGAQLELSGAAEQLTSAIVLSLFVLIGNPIIVMIIMGLMGYRSRTSFRAGLTVAQISEFSLILAAIGASLGAIGAETVTLITVVGLITIALSTYMITNADWLHAKLEGPLRVFERRSAGGKALPPEAIPDPDAVVFGLGRYGKNLVRRLKDEGMEVLGIDLDPATVREWREREGDEGTVVLYGDAYDADLFDVLPVSSASWLVSSMRTLEISMSLLAAARAHRFEGRIAVTALSDADELRLRDAGADLVLRPFADAAADAVAAMTAQAGRGGDEAARTEALGEQP